MRETMRYLGIACVAGGLLAGSASAQNLDVKGTITGEGNASFYQNVTVAGGITVGGTVSGPALAASQPGVVFMFAGVNCPNGSLPADGRPVSRTTYANLFGGIGTLHGVGDGSTTFNLPDLRGQFVRGAVGFTSKTFQPSAVNVTTDLITIPNHGLQRSGFPVRLRNESGLDIVTPPGGLSFGVTYWAIYVDANNFKVARTEGNAIAGTAIDLTSTGFGMMGVLAAADPDAGMRTTGAPGGATRGAVGSVQADGVGTAQVPITTSNYVSAAAPVYWSSKSALAAGFSKSVADSWEGWGLNTHSTITPRTEANLNLGTPETRPRNLALLYCIQY